MTNLRNEKLKGHQIRSRFQHFKDWEKPSKYFLNMEKKNYINKNIIELKDSNNKIINDSNKILKEQASFYETLFSSKGCKTEEHTRYNHFLTNLPTISEDVKLKIDAEISLTELEDSIKNSKNNKAPGPDGFSNEFFKVFSYQLKYWILRLFRESLESEQFPDTILEGIIPCIPKTGKERNLLKNWRPLTMLNSIYKFFSSIMAKRIKSTLNQIINPDQTGFISNRFIGENSRLLFDTLCHCENTDTPGMLIIVDYAKAFDTIEWNFIDKYLGRFGFGPFIRNSVKLLQTNSFSRVEQNGHLSDKIQLSRGCRQGDPISPYLFVICAEVLSHVIRECDDIKGIKIGDTEIKLSQYADDTTLFLNGDKKSLEIVMDILRWFNKLSGLGINRDKTKVIKIGALRDRRMSWEGKFGLEWTHSFVVLGIHYDDNNLSETTDTNLYLKINDIKKLKRTWSSRSLTPYGKVTIVKSLLLSKITHILLSLPSPSVIMFKNIEKMFLDFIWNNKPVKFSKSILEAEIKNGGLKLHNLKIFDQSLKLGWIKRFSTSNGKWKIFLELEEFHKIYTFGVDYAERMLDVIQIPFWVDVSCSLKALWKCPVITDVHNVLLFPLWYNDVLRLPLKPVWFQKGISVIADLMDDSCSLMSMDVFQDIYHIKTNFLEYGGIMLTIKYFIDNQEVPEYKPVRPINSLLNIILHKDYKGVSNLYKCMYPSNCDILGNICTKWYDKAGLIFTTQAPLSKLIVSLMIFT